MTRYAIHVIDLDEGTVQGTNNVEDVQDVMSDDRYVIMMAQSGVYFHGDTSEIQIEPFPSKEDLTDPDDDQEEEDEDNQGGG
jgi:hypothetical protein